MLWNTPTRSFPKFAHVHRLEHRMQIRLPGIDIAVTRVAPKRQIRETAHQIVAGLLVVLQHVLLHMAPTLHSMAGQALHVLSNIAAGRTRGLQIYREAVSVHLFAGMRAIQQWAHSMPAGRI